MLIDILTRSCQILQFAVSNFTQLLRFWVLKAVLARVVIKSLR